MPDLPYKCKIDREIGDVAADRRERKTRRVREKAANMRGRRYRYLDGSCLDRTGLGIAAISGLIR